MSELTDGKETLRGNRFQKLTKIEAARRQLVTAIRLFLSEEDAVSIHTLSSAAHGILADLLHKKGGRSFLNDGITVFVHTEDVAKYQRQIREPQNFLKHANRDPDGILEFSPGPLDVWLFDCLKMYRELTGTMFQEGNLFSIWFVLLHPEFLLSGKYPPEIKKLAQSFEPTKEFFLELLEKGCIDELPQIVFQIPE